MVCDKWKTKGEILLEQEVTKLSLDLLGKTLLATDFSQYEEKMMTASRDMHEYILGCMKNPFVTNINLPFGRFKKARRSLALFHQILEDILTNMENREKVAFLEDVSVLSPQDYKDMVLNIFLQAMKRRQLASFGHCRCCLITRMCMRRLKRKHVASQKRT